LAPLVVVESINVVVIGSIKPVPTATPVVSTGRATVIPGTGTGPSASGTGASGTGSGG